MYEKKDLVFFYKIIYIWTLCSKIEIEILIYALDLDLVIYKKKQIKWGSPSQISSLKAEYKSD